MTEKKEEGIHFASLSRQRKLENLSANELRARLIMAGKEIPDGIRKKSQLIELVKKI